MKEKYKKYYKTHVDKIKKYLKNYRETHADEILQKTKKYREQNQDKCRTISKNYYKIHANEIKERKRKYYEKKKIEKFKPQYCGENYQEKNSENEKTTANVKTENLKEVKNIFQEIDTNLL